MKMIAVCDTATGVIRAVTNVGLTVRHDEELILADGVSVRHYMKDGKLLLWDGPIGDPAIDDLYAARFPALLPKEPDNE
ncbi:MAG: hypothetical protein HGA87_00165 [Desulfobulbaceae bacterium]|jgi:hypothetical protein|nr:hypothetical protein [Desulfobulbaceae bacterium]